MIAVVHTGGYEVIQVEALEGYKLKAECLFLICLELLFALYCDFGISLEALIRLHDAWRTYD